ncbi:sodium:alanine symporter family protein [Balneolales bacterium ANBcel1]|nr:sodium:alanine symporter family protein [Balneolales bacterium ANBcel1]
MELFETVINTLEKLVWNTPETMPLMVIALLSFGLFITLRLGFIQVRKFRHGLQVLSGKYHDKRDDGDVNHFQALSTALSATVGIGNIAGVALAIHFGGPGALFWMWLTAIFGMAIKYSECTLGTIYRRKNADGSVSGGPMYYIERGLGKRWKWLAVAFASFAVICSFLTGNGVQANSVADAMQSTFGIPKVLTGLATATAVGLVIIGGIKRIGIVTARLVPVMAAFYLIGAMIILIIHHTELLPSLALIFTSAFSPEAGAFGIGGGAFMVTFVWGIRRGLFSNEAGQGSAPIAHAASKTDQPVRVGVVALMEPFIDTIIICTMTGLVIITTASWDTHHPANLNLNHQELAFVVQQDTGESDSQTIHIEQGLPVDGEILYYGYPVDTLFTDAERAFPFTGSLVIGVDGALAFDRDDEPHTHLHTGVIQNGAPLTAAAFERGLSPLFPGGRYLVTICVLLFAISTSISWSYYGDRSIQYLFGDRSIFYYRIVYVLMHFTGAIVSLGLVWTFGDIMLGLMTLPNLIALFALSGVVYKATQKYFDNPDI